VFVINETKHQLMSYFGSGQRFGCTLSYVIQETSDNGVSSSSPGLAHALDSAYHLTAGKTVYFGMADTIVRPAEVFARGRANLSPDDDVILILFQTTRPEKFGMVRLTPDGRVLEIVDKPTKSDLTEMWGCIIWRSRFTDYLHESVGKRNIGDFALIMNNAIRDGLNFRGMRLGESYIDFGTYEEIMEAKSSVDVG
jgi:dTDP-glucose pyrophosphorylase